MSRKEDEYKEDTSQIIIISLDILANDKEDAEGMAVSTFSLIHYDLDSVELADNDGN